MSNPMRFTIPEILKAVSEAKTHAQKVSILQNCGTEPLEQILQYNFHPDISFSLPEGDAPYKKEVDLPVGKSHSNLYKEGRRLYIFLIGYAPNLKPYRKEQLFIELLEGIHWTEADLLIAVKDKNLESMYPGVTYEAARDAFDRLLPAQVPPKKVKPVVVAKEQVQEVELPLELPVSYTPTKVDSVSDTVTPKTKEEIARAKNTEKTRLYRARKKAAKEAAKVE